MKILTNIEIVTTLMLLSGIIVCLENASAKSSTERKIAKTCKNKKTIKSIKQNKT